MTKKVAKPAPAKPASKVPAPKAPTAKPNKNEGLGRTDMWKPKFSQLRVDAKKNVREDYGNIPELAASIRRTNGPKVALIGYREKVKGDWVFWVTDGFRRYFAMEYNFKQHGIDHECKFMVEPQFYTDKERLIDMFTYGSGKPLTPVEQAKGIERLINEHNMTEAQVGEQLGIAQGYVNKLRELVDMDPRLTKLIAENTISATTAINLVVHGEDKEFLEDFEKGEYSEQVQKAAAANARNATPKHEPTLFETHFGANGEGNAVAGATGNEQEDIDKAGVTPVAKTAVIRPKDIRIKQTNRALASGKVLNSGAELKKYIMNFEGKPKKIHQQQFLLMLAKVYDNKATSKDFDKVFKS